jgi:hypothetical protein
MSAGSAVTERDFGDVGPADCRLSIDVDELSGATFRAHVYTRETDTDGWWYIGGTGSDEVDTIGHFSFQRLRYVRVEIVTTGSDLPADAVGF